MPSPIAHLAAGYAVHMTLCRPDDQRQIGSQTRPLLLFAAAAFSLLPDIDLVPVLLLKKRWEFHRHLTHSVSVGFGAALVAGLVGRFALRESFVRWFAVTSISYLAHLVLDSFTPGQGVMLVWPFRRTRFRSPIALFYGFYWTRGLRTPRHLLTALSEIAFSALVLSATRRFVRSRRSVRES
jgi:membrane-bound metal-dependent hydrolase YbcI (DUF457 family)